MKKIITLILLVLFSSITNADDGTFGLTSGFDYSSGKYGKSEPTRIKYIPITGKYTYDRWLFKITVPWLEIDGSSGATGGDSKIIIERNSYKHTRQSGLGDIVSSITYTALESNEYKFILDAGAKVKFGTASVSKGLGSGENDYAFQLDAYKTLEKLTLMSTVGYRVIGNPGNSEYSLQNVWFGSVGAAYKIDAKNSAGLFVDLREAAWEYNTNIREYTVYYSHRFSPTYNIQSYVTTGDTSSSVDFGGGIMLGGTW
jgi:hypothetical protein